MKHAPGGAHCCNWLLHTIISSGVGADKLKSPPHESRLVSSERCVVELKRLRRGDFCGVLDLDCCVWQLIYMVDDPAMA